MNNIKKKSLYFAMNVSVIIGCGALTIHGNSLFNHYVDLPLTFSNFKKVMLSFGLTNLGIIGTIASTVTLGYNIKDNIIMALITKNKNQNQK